MTRRTDRIATLLEQAVGKVLARGLADPRVQGLITVTGVRVSDDLARATVLVSVTPESKQRVTLAGLSAAARHIRHEASNLIDLRRMPQLTIELDEGLKRQAGVEQALARVAQERLDRAAPRDATEAEADTEADAQADSQPTTPREIRPS